MQDRIEKIIDLKASSARRVDAYRGNEQGWSEQVKNIVAHVES